MDWGGWALFGLIATAALTAVMLSAQLAGLTRLDFRDDETRAQAPRSRR